MTITLEEIWRYPVKGLAGERLEEVELNAEENLPFDRRFALAHGASQFNAASPEWAPKTSFYVLATDEKLAQLTLSYDEASGILTIFRKGKQVARGNPSDKVVGQSLLNQFFSSFLTGSGKGNPRIVELPGKSLTDVPENWVSIINLESVRDLERVAREHVDPRRFRGNLIIAGAPAWSEFVWVGQKIKIGEAVLQVKERIDRCPATNVNPDTAERDMNIPLTLRSGFRHADMGVYAEVIEGGRIRPDDEVTPP